MRFLLPILLLAGCTTPTATTPTPQSIGEQFCKIAQSSKDSATFLPLAGPDLSLLIQKAEQDNEAIAKAATDEKPPLGDGLPFQASPDYTPVCKVGTITRNQLKTVVEIHHIFTDKQNAPYSWTDKLVLDSQTNLIDDILFGPDYTTGMSSSLVSAFDSYK